MRAWSKMSISTPIWSAGVLSVLLISSALFVTTSLASSSISYSAFVVMILFLLSALMVGRAIMALAQNVVPPSALVPAELLIGIAILSAIMLLACLITKASANATLIFACGIGLIAAIFNAQNWTAIDVDSRTSFWAIIAISTISVIWSWQAIWAFPKLGHEYIFYAWTDFFYHSSMITQFAHLSDLGGTWIFAHGANIPIYHYSSYMFPAAISAFSNLPSLAIATAFVEPFSFIVMGLGAWVLGVVIAGRLGGGSAIAAIMMLPDVSYYFIYDFHWLLQVTSLGYAIGLSLLIVALGVIAVREHSVAAFSLATPLTLMLASFKFQLFVLVLLSGLTLVTLYWRPNRRWIRWACLFVLCVSGLASAAIAELLPRAPHFFSAHRDPSLLLQNLIAPGTIRDNLPIAIALPAQLTLLLLQAFGAVLPAYIFGIFACRKAKMLSSADLFPLAVVATYLLMALVFPYDQFNDYKYQTFTLVYAILVVWCACFIVRILNATLSGYTDLIVVLLWLILLPFPFFLQRTAQSGRSEYSLSYFKNQVPRGLLRSAEYIRKNSSKAAVILKSSDDGEVPHFGSLTAISERPSFILLFRSDLAWRLWGIPLDFVRRREAISKEILHAQTFEELSRVAQSAGIDWYLLSPPDSYPLDITKNAVFAADGYFVFHTERGQLSSAP